MPGSLLICQEIKLSNEELQKISGGSFISPGDLPGSGGATEEAKQLAASLKESEAREEKAYASEAKAKRLSTAITVGSFLIAAGGLYLSWRATHRK